MVADAPFRAREQPECHDGHEAIRALRLDSDEVRSRAAISRHSAYAGRWKRFGVD